MLAILHIKRERDYLQITITINTIKEIIKLSIQQTIKIDWEINNIILLEKRNNPLVEI